MKVVEERKIDFEKVHGMCIGNELYDCGTNEDYNNLLLNLCNHSKNITTKDIIEIAEDILIHSDTEMEITSIMFMIANECCYTVFEVV